MFDKNGTLYHSIRPLFTKTMDTLVEIHWRSCLWQEYRTSWTSMFSVDCSELSDTIWLFIDSTLITRNFQSKRSLLECFLRYGQLLCSEFSKFNGNLCEAILRYCLWQMDTVRKCLILLICKRSIACSSFDFKQLQDKFDQLRMRVIKSV